MHFPFTRCITSPVEFQQPLEGEPVEQDKAAFSLEILEHIGRMCPDVATAVTFTRTCRMLYLCRPKILTGHLPKLQWTIQKLISHQSYLASFLDHCTTSPFRNAAFEIAGSQLADKKLITAVLPNVKVKIPGFVDDFDVGGVLRVYQQIFNAVQVLRGEAHHERRFEPAVIIAGIAMEALPWMPQPWRPRGLIPQPVDRLPVIFERAPQLAMEDDLYTDVEREVEVEVEQQVQVEVDLYDMINNIRV